MELSKRLYAVAGLVTEGASVADIGTDHGYVPIYLMKNGIASKVIAMDINKGPLERATLHIAESGMKDVIETRLSDGLTALKAGEVDSIVIAGMGGPLMIRILSAYPEVTASAKELILQPQSEILEVRRWLYQQGYEIVEEHMVYEDGKYYPMFKAVKNPQAKALSYLEYKFGRLEVLKEKEVLKDFILRELANKQQILQKLQEEQTEKSKDRAEEMKQLIKELEEMCNVM